MIRPKHAGEDQTEVEFDLSYTMPELEPISALNYYPDPQYRSLKEQIADFRHVCPEQLVVANGSSSLIHAIVRAQYLWVPPERRDSSQRWSGAPAPSYLEYQYASEMWGFRFHYGPGGHLPGYFSHWLYSSRPELAWWCNPHNPTGFYQKITSEYLNYIHPETHLIVDEAYLFQSGHLDESVTQYQDVFPNVVVLGTLSKDFGMPGARVGYAIFSRESVFQAHVQDQIEPWPISGISVAYARNRLEYLDMARELNREAVLRAEFLRRSCEEIGFGTVKSQTAFFLLGLSQPAQAVLEDQYKIRVRRCADYGFPDYVRIVSRSEESDQALLRALREVYVTEVSKVPTDKT